MAMENKVREAEKEKMRQEHEKNQREFEELMAKRM